MWPHLKAGPLVEQWASLYDLTFTCMFKLIFLLFLPFEVVWAPHRFLGLFQQSSSLCPLHFLSSSNPDQATCYTDPLILRILHVCSCLNMVTESLFPVLKKYQYHTWNKIKPHKSTLRYAFGKTDYSITSSARRKSFCSQAKCITSSMHFLFCTCPIVWFLKQKES